MLVILVRSTLATTDDSGIVQVIAEHAALGDAGQEDDHAGTETGDPINPAPDA